MGLGSAHNKTLQEGLHAAVSSGWGCDVVFRFDDGTNLLSVKWIWMLRSEYFRTMFTTLMRESRENCIPLGEVNGDAVRAIFRSLLTGELSLNNDNVGHVLDASDRLLFPTIKDLCGRYLLDHLAPQNCLSILNLADRYGFTELRSASVTSAARGLDSIKGSEDFLQLSEAGLVEIAQHRAMGLSTDALLDVVMPWVRFDTAARGATLPRLLDVVCLELLSPKLLTGLIADPVALAHAIAQLQAAILLQSGQGVHRSQIRHRRVGLNRLGDRSVVAVAAAHVVAGAVQPGAVHTYDPATKQLAALPHSDISVLEPVVCFHDGLLIVAGGYEGPWATKRIVATVRCFDPVLHSWTEMTPLTTPRYGAAMVVLGEHLLIIGGFDTRRLTTVERYSFVTRAWTALAPLPSARCSMTAAVHGGQLFVFGGYTGGTTVTDEVLLYDSEGDRWEVVARLSQPRCQVRLASDLDGGIFVVGGLSWDAAGQPQRSSVVEYFNTSTRTVSVLPPLPEPRLLPGVVFVGGQLHVFGGQLQDGTRCSTSTSLTVGPNGSPVAGWSDPQPTLPGPMWFDAVFHDFV